MPLIELIGVNYSISHCVHNFFYFRIRSADVFVGADGLRSKPCAEETFFCYDITTMARCRGLRFPVGTFV